MARSCEIGKSFTFDAAHWLPYVPADHKCRRMHGHTYRVEIVCFGEIVGPGSERAGMVCDYAVLSSAWRKLNDLLDHRTLNDVPGLENPTAELLAGWIADHIDVPHLSRVRVSETPNTWAEVTR